MASNENYNSSSSPSDIFGWGPEKFKEILKNNNIQDEVSEVIIKESGLKGENLASLTYCVTVKFENSLREPIHLFVKRQPDNVAHVTMVTESKLFQKETMFFMEYLPEVRKLCQKFGQENLLDIYPKCYYGDDKLIVLENLILNKGFTLLDKEEMQDFDAAQIALTNLAKHHALSYAFIKEMGGSQNFLKRFPDFNFIGFDCDSVRALLVPYVQDPLDTSINILSKSNQEGKEKAIEVLKMYQVNTYEKFLEPLKRKCDENDVTVRVLNHGDYWNSNMMFLKDKINKDKFEGHVLIDFQLVHFTTPAVDIGYYLFTSVKPAVRQANLKKFLEIYLEAFKNATSALSCPVKMTYDDIFKDFRETFIHGFLLGLGLCTGIGYAVMADADPTEIDMENFANIMSKLVEKWIENNPDKNEENAKILMSVVEEHQNLIM